MDEEPEEVTTEKTPAALTLLQRAAQREQNIKNDLAKNWQTMQDKLPILTRIVKVLDMNGLFTWLQGISSRIGEAIAVYVMMVWSIVCWLWSHRTAIHFWFQFSQCIYHYKAIARLTGTGQIMFLLQRLVAAPLILIVLEWILVIIVYSPVWTWGAVSWTYAFLKRIPLVSLFIWVIEKMFSPFVNAMVWLISWIKPKSKVAKRR